MRILMGKYKLLALAAVFVCFERVPAQVVTFTSPTKLIIVNVSVKDKNGKPIDYGSVVESNMLLAKIDTKVRCSD